MNIIVFTAGPMTDNVIKLTYEQNLTQQKVQNIIVLTTNPSKKFSLPYLSTRKEEIDGLVYSVVTEIKTLLDDINQIVD